MCRFVAPREESLSSMPSIIRLAAERDADQFLEIYGPFCESTPVSFELEPPSLEAMQARIEQTLQQFPWLVCESDGLIRGYVYASRHRERAAYQWSADVTAYIRHGEQRRGLGRALSTSLFQLLVLQGYY